MREADVIGLPAAARLERFRWRDTIVCVADGNIAAIGGLMGEMSARGKSGLPGAGDLPIAGHAFGNEPAHAEDRTGRSARANHHTEQRDVEAGSTRRATAPGRLPVYAGARHGEERQAQDLGLSRLSHRRAVR